MNKEVKEFVKPLEKISIRSPNVVNSIKTECGTINDLQYRFKALVVDKTDELIVKTVIGYAQKEGYTDLFLLDENFVKDALKHEKERREQPQTNRQWLESLTDEELVKVFNIDDCCYCPIHNIEHKSCWENTGTCIEEQIKWLKQEHKED